MTRTSICLTFLMASVALASAVAVPAAALAAPGAGFAWTSPYSPGTTSATSFSSVVPGPAGSVYAAGNYESSMIGLPDGSRLLAARVDAATGSLIWQRTTKGPRRRGVSCAGATSDAAGNLTIIGRAATGKWNIYVARYDSNGKLLWWRQADGSAHHFDNPAAVATNARGAAYVGGWLSDRGYGEDGVVLKYGATGILRWKYLLRTKHIDEVHDIVVDAAGNVYAVGTRNGTRTTSQLVVVKLSRGGKLVWLKTIRAAATAYFGERMVLAPDAVYAAGIRGAGATNTPVVAKYDLAGTRAWLTQDDSNMVELRDAALDPSGRLILAGDAWDDAANMQEGSLVAFDATGARCAAATYINNVSGHDAPASFKSLAVDRTGMIYVGGAMSQSDDGSWVYASSLALRYPAVDVSPWQPQTTWVHPDTGIGNWNRCNSVLLTSDDNVYVGGMVQTTMTGPISGYLQKLGSTP